MLSEERKEEIRQTLVEMAKTRRHASAMLWISELPIEEEDYARSIFGEVEQVAAGGSWNMLSGRVPVSKVWDKPEIEPGIAALYDRMNRLYPPVMSGLTSFADGMQKAIDSLNKLLEVLPPNFPPMTMPLDVDLSDRAVYVKWLEQNWAPKVEWVGDEAKDPEGADDTGDG